jgi:hypothetical protein
MPSKARAIRNITKDDPSKSCAQIRTEAKQNYGLKVNNNQITNILGPYKERMNSGPAGQTKMRLTKNFRDSFSDLREATLFLHRNEETNE